MSVYRARGARAVGTVRGGGGSPPGSTRPARGGTGGPAIGNVHGLGYGLTKENTHD